LTVSATGCGSTTDEVIVTSELVPVEDIEVCSGESGIISIPETGSYLWFDQSSGGTELASGQSYTTPQLTADATYFVENADAGNGGNCAGVEEWNSTNIYERPADGSAVYATYNGTLYALADGVWWSQGSNPEQYPNIWVNQGECSSACVRSAVTAKVKICTDVIEGQQDKRPEVYPNPTSGSFEIKNMVGDYQLYNSLGHIVSQGKVDQSVHINISDQPAGVYYLLTQGETETKSISIKIIKE
jgi:hypothetical protein